MISDIIIVYNNDSQIKNIGDTLKVSPFFTFLNENSKKDKKKAYALKSHWAARMTPFAICMDKEIPIKAFYSESEENVIESLINYLNENIHS